MNKKLLFTGLTLLSLLAFGAVQQMDRTSSPRLQSILSGIVVGPLKTQATNTLINANRITRALAATSTIDFASQTATCVDSSAIAVIGAQLGDPCIVGQLGTTANASYTCFVSSADNVKIRFCPTGAGALDPASQVFKIRTISAL